MAAAAAARAEGEDAQVLGFTPRDFVIFGLPYKNPKSSLYVRRNAATLTPASHGRASSSSGLREGRSLLRTIVFFTGLELRVVRCDLLLQEPNLLCG
jgi:hypothetical protein